MKPTDDIASCASLFRKQMMLLVRRLRRDSIPRDLLPLGQLLLLSRIEELGNDATPTAPAAYEGLRPQNLSALLRKLEQMGLTFKEENIRDKRKSYVRLTENGLHLLTTNRSNRDNWLSQIMTKELNNEEIDLLQKAGHLLERLASTPEPQRKHQEK